MCQLFIDADSALWQSSTRSMRVDGVVTSIRLEAFFWNTLAEIAARDELSVAQLLSRLYLESMDAGHDLGNFTSFLRVCCGRYLSLAADELINREMQMPLANIEASALLSQERSKREQRTLLIRDSRTVSKNTQ